MASKIVITSRDRSTFSRPSSGYYYISQVFEDNSRALIGTVISTVREETVIAIAKILGANLRVEVKVNFDRED